MELVYIETGSLFEEAAWYMPAWYVDRAGEVGNNRKWSIMKELKTHF
jgi:hypothetical protein